MPGTRAQKDHFGLKLDEQLDVGRRQFAAMPWLDPVGSDDQVRRVANLVDFDEAGTVRGDGVEGCRRVRVELQFALGFLVPLGSRPAR